jgi:predicted PurR-regulated permease PerM
MDWMETCYHRVVNHVASEPSRGSSFFSTLSVRATILAVAIGGAFFLCILMIRPFLAVITWATALAIIAYPLQAWLERRMRPNFAALIAVCFVIVVVVTPAIVLSQRLFVELNESLRIVANDLTAANLEERLRQYPTLANALEWIETRLDLDQQFRAAGGVVAGKLSTWLSGSVWFVTQLFLTFLTLFYFLRDRAQLLGFFRRFIPLSPPETDQIFSRISQTVNTSLYKNVLVKLIQGILGGAMFWILGLPAPVLSGAVMALLAVLPVMGTALVWAPAAIALALTGSWVKAVILTAWGSLVVGLIDNFLYPILVANELRFHPLSVLFAIFGGLLVFGLAGAVLGPVILAITVALLEIWQVRKGTVELPGS